MFDSPLTRYIPQGSGYLIYLLDKLAREPLAVDAPQALVPTWKAPQAAPNRHEEHEINLVIEGAMRFRYWIDANEKVVTVAAGQMLTIPRGVLHTVEVDESAIVRGFWIHPKRFTAIDSAAKIHEPHLSSDPRIFTSLQEIWVQTQIEYARRDHWQEATLDSLAQLSTINFLRVLQTRPAPLVNTTTERVREVAGWIERHHLAKPSLAVMARRAGLSPSHFNEIFKRETGCSAGVYLMNCRLNHARQLLEMTTYSSAQVADAVGFDSASTFHHTFKKQFGLTPGEARENYNKNVILPNADALPNCEIEGP